MASAILLAGGTGFLGRHLLRALLARGTTVLLVKRSSSRLEPIAELMRDPLLRTFDLDRIPLESVFAENEVSTVINTATRYGRGEPLADVLRANLTFPVDLLELAGKHRVAQFLNAGTSLPRHLSAYSLAKAQFVEWMERLSGALRCVNLRLEHFYGSGDHPSKFISWVVRSLLDRCPSLELTAGTQQRDFVHVDDVVDGILRVLEARDRLPEGFQTFELGTGASTTIREVVELIRDCIGNSETRLHFGGVPFREGEVMISRADLKAMEQLGWRPRISLREGLARTVEEERALSSAGRSPR
ncbi:MAG: NAD(P)-dependent oxidoreductase [Armatimonadetes bacterium]|nr:NAD(P)-dependent oxidoreductase [Armatimonadota bacterium]